MKLLDTATLPVDPVYPPRLAMLGGGIGGGLLIGIMLATFLRARRTGILYPEGMQFVLPEQALPAKLTLNPELAMNDDDYFEFCAANEDVRFERNEQGEIIIVPPAGPESDYRNADVIAQLRTWARRDGRGKAFGSSTEFFLPTGAALSPDGAWISNVLLSQFSKGEKRKFLHISPEFIVEVMSPSDRLSGAIEKMQMWMRGGVELAWLIDGDNKTVHVYRSGREAEVCADLTTLKADGPIAGFELDLTDIWVGL